MPDTVNQKISELPAATSPGNNDVLAGVQSSTTKKFTLSALKTFFQSGLTKSSVGLGNVDNTSDANKPVSTAQQAAIDGRVPTTRTINGNALTGNITLDAEDVGAPTVADLDNVAAAKANFALGNNFGVCSTASGTAAKEVTIPGITELVDGLSIRVLFVNRNTVSIPTLNINSLGAYPIYRDSYVMGANEIRDQSIRDFVFRSNQWVCVDGARASTSYYGITKLSSSVTDTTELTAATSKAVKTAYDAATTNLAPVEASSTASTNYAVGEHLVLNGVLYEVTAAIASGETITPGTNVSATTVTGITDGLDTRITALETALDGVVSQLSQM